MKKKKIFIRICDRCSEQFETPHKRSSVCNGCDLGYAFKYDKKMIEATEDYLI